MNPFCARVRCCCALEKIKMSIIDVERIMGQKNKTRLLFEMQSEY